MREDMVGGEGKRKIKEKGEDVGIKGEEEKRTRQTGEWKRREEKERKEDWAQIS